MKKLINIFTLTLALTGQNAFAAKTLDLDTEPTKDEVSCDMALKDFPYIDIDAVGSVEKLEVGLSEVSLVKHEGMPVYSRMKEEMGALGIYFQQVVAPQMIAANPRDRVNYMKATEFLDMFGLMEMKTLGPDLTKDNPMLDATVAKPEVPSKSLVDETTATLEELASNMQELLGEDQRTVLKKLFSGDFSSAVEDISAAARNIALKYSITRQVFEGFITKKDLLIDISNHFKHTQAQFQSDVVFMEEVKARLIKARESLEFLRDNGKQILATKEKILSKVTDPEAKKALEKVFLRFQQRVTDLTQGITIAETFWNYWNILFDNHIDLINSIRRVRYYTIPILATQQEMEEALARQARLRVAIAQVDNYTTAMTKMLMERMTGEQQNAFQFELKAIEDRHNALAEMALGTIALVEARKLQDKELSNKLTEVEAEYDKLNEKLAAERRKYETGGIDLDGQK